MSSITPNYRFGHRQTVPVADEIAPEAPPSYELATNSSQGGQTSRTPASPTRPATVSSLSSSAASEQRVMLSQTPSHTSRNSSPHRAQYQPPKPMKVYYEMDDVTRTTLENTPGCCFSTTGGCCFSQMGGCCFSDTAGCCFSSNAGCCFSDTAGCCFSDNGGCCFSTNGGCCFTDGAAPPGSTWGQSECQR